MNDEDEEVAHLRAPDTADNDQDEEAQDFRRLDKLMCAIGSQQKLFYS
jgi:tRNA-splicing endonuclease subunit Sen54